MKWRILIAHAEGEEHLAERLAEPLRDAGYEVAHRGTVMVGESVTEEASKVLNTGGPVVLCGTVKAVGTGWAHRLVNAARQHPQIRVFAVQMEKDAYAQMLSLDGTVALYWQDPAKAVQDLIASLQKYYPLDAGPEYVPFGFDAEQRYRELALESCDIIDLANLPESDRHIATRQLELRRLYVPLRVQVEIVSDTEMGETELETLEKRRAASLWGRADRGEREAERARVPVGERLAKARRLVVLGDPGAGKTTMVRWIATAYLLRLKQDPDWEDLPDVATLPDEDWLPIIIRCRDLDESCMESLEDILCHTLRRAELTQAESEALRTVLWEKLDKGEAFLLLDGLDEIQDPAVRARFCRQVEQIHIAYPDTPIIATSRIVGYREMGYRIGRGFEHVTIADLSQEDKDDFARRWCTITELPERRETATVELIHDIHSTDRIERLTGNPMLLTTLALVKRKVGKLPNRRADLYWEAVQVLLNWRSEVDEPIDHYEAIPQLEYVAYAMCDQGAQQLREDEIIGLFERMREEYPSVHAVRNHTAEDFLRLLERRTGILVEAGHVRHLGRPVPVLEFRHLTFQEYLAGLALVDGRFPCRDRSRSLAEYVAPLAGRTSEVEDQFGEREVTVTENWREALRLCVASCNDDDVDDTLLAILNPLKDEDPRTTTCPRAVLAALCLADEPNASEDVAQAVLQEFVRQAGKRRPLRAFGIDLQAAAAELTASRWSKALRSLLVEEFRKGDMETRSMVGLLSMTARTQLTPEDEAMLPEWPMAQAARIVSGDEVAAINAALGIMELAFHQKVRVVPGMVEGLLDVLTTSAPVSHAAAWTLFMLCGIFQRKGWRPLTADLERILSVVGDPLCDAGAFYFLALILGREGDTRAVEPLLGRLEDENSEVQKAAVSALGRIGDSRVVEPLLAKLQDQDGEVRQEAASAVADIGDVRALEPLLARLGDQDSDVRQAVASALGQIGDARAVEPLLARLEDEDSDVQKAAAGALGRIGDARAVEPLLAKLEDQDGDVRQAVASALGQIGGSRAVEPLLAKLEDQDGDVRQAVASALADIGDVRAVEPLLSGLEDKNSDVRQEVARALGQIGDSRVVEPLLSRLEDEDSDVQQAAAGALGQIGDSRAVEPLLARLEDEDSDVQQAAAGALGQIGDSRAVEPLLAKLEDENSDVRQAAAWALGQIGDSRAAKPLLARLEDEDSDVQQAVTWVLGQIGDMQVVEPLLTRLEDQDGDVRRDAAWALGQIGDSRAAKPLLARLEDEDRDVRQAVAWALGRIGDVQVVELLLARLDDWNGAVRGAAAGALGDIGDVRAVEPLLARLEDWNSAVRGAAAEALGQIRDTQVVEPLLAKLEDWNSNVRGAAAEALGRIGDTRAVELLLAKLEDWNSNVRGAAAEALGQIGDTQVVEPLLARLEDWNSNVRGAAAEALGQIGDARAVEPLIARLEDQDSGVRQAAARALGEIGDAWAFEPLLARLADQNSDVRRAAAWALGQIGDARAFEPLLVKLEDQDRNVREAAARALGWIEDARAFEPLLARLEDQDSDVREAAARALGWIEGARAVEPLLARLEDQDSDVRQAVAEALGRIGDARAVEPLLARLEDQDSDVREAVAEALGRIRDARAVEPLLTRLEDQDSDVREAAAEALGRVGDARAVEPLLAKLEDQNRYVRRAVTAALVQFGHARTIEVLTGKLSVDNQYERVKALEALSLTCKDETDRKLLSRDLDAREPFLDPQNEISERRIRQAAKELKMPAEEVRRRYEMLAQQFPLKLAWQASS